MGCVPGFMGCVCPGVYEGVWGIWGVSWGPWGVYVLGSMGGWVYGLCPGTHGVCPGVPGVHAVHGGWGAWVPGAQLSSPRDAGQASLAVLSPGDVGWHWLGMRNVGQEGRPPPLLGTVGGGGSTGPGRVPFKAPSGQGLSPCPAYPLLTCFPGHVTQEGGRTPPSVFGAPVL